MGKTYTVAQFKEAIPGSGGIMSTIAKRVGCDWNTAKKRIDGSPVLSQMYQDERESILDMAESVLFKNIKDGDSADAKWVLSRLGKDRGFSERQEFAHSGRIDFGSLSDAELEAIASGQSSGGA